MKKLLHIFALIDVQHILILATVALLYAGIIGFDDIKYYGWVLYGASIASFFLFLSGNYQSEHKTTTRVFLGLIMSLSGLSLSLETESIVGFEKVSLFFAGIMLVFLLQDINNETPPPC